MRKRRAEKRQIPPDPIYGDVLVAKFINKVMLKGKKSKAERIVYRAFEIIRKRTRQDPLKIFHKALENVKPEMEVRPRRVGGATYQIPIPVPDDRGYSLAMRWIIQVARERRGKPMEIKLAEELLEAYQGRGAAVKKKEDTHRMAEANRAFAHYRW